MFFWSVLKHVLKHTQPWFQVTHFARNTSYKFQIFEEFKKTLKKRKKREEFKNLLNKDASINLKISLSICKKNQKRHFQNANVNSLK